jgi:hypothetical protein
MIESKVVAGKGGYVLRQRLWLVKGPSKVVAGKWAYHVEPLSEGKIHTFRSSILITGVGTWGIYLDWVSWHVGDSLTPWTITQPSFVFPKLDISFSLHGRPTRQNRSVRNRIRHDREDMNQSFQYQKRCDEKIFDQ